MKVNYSELRVELAEAKEIARSLYQLDGNLSPLAGELDFNFRVITSRQDYILKISRPDASYAYLDFQNQILQHIQKSTVPIQSPISFPDIHGNYISSITDASGNKRYVRLLSWIPGRLWSEVNPHTNHLLRSLGMQLGKLAIALMGFDHKLAHRHFEWDVANAAWTENYNHLFKDKQLDILSAFQQQFSEIQAPYQQLRKSVIHNDANDNNILVGRDLINGNVEAIIDYGDAVHTQLINDLAVCLAYAMMNKPDPLAAAMEVLKAYHQENPLKEEELQFLYVLVAMRLLITVTKSAINREQEPENKYLLVSEKPAWDLLHKWAATNADFAHYAFRMACGFSAHPKEDIFIKWATEQETALEDVFPTLSYQGILSLDMSIGSTWLGNASVYNNNEKLAFEIQQFKHQHESSLIAGGYLETRPIYCTDAYKMETNNGPSYRSIHLGIDVWVAAGIPIHAPFDGEVIAVHDNGMNKDYGPTILLKHQIDMSTHFYTLYGHLSTWSITNIFEGQAVKKGDLIAYIGNSNENGDWVPHLHFQIILDLLGNTNNFPGVSKPEQMGIWKSICPDPNFLFKSIPKITKAITIDMLIPYRKEHLGKSLSLSYREPLYMLRGDGAFLIDENGHRYLDTVNNVAHVGHEHPRVVETGQRQMALLNTNTRYLHHQINNLSEKLLETFPGELSVVHFVNSGSEANELALRMAYAFTNQKDIIAVEVGYHGNTNSCVGISSYKFDGKGGEGAPEHTHIVPLPDTYRGLYQGKDQAANYVSHIDDHIRKLQLDGRKIAAFICESIISCGGQIELPEGYLSQAYEMVHRAGGLCIADEVQVGCGRMGETFWGFQLHGVIPDIVTIGKPLGNGHPLAAVVCTKEVAESFANGMEYFNTFGGNPVSCAIGLEVLKVIEDEGLQGNAYKVGNYLKAGLKELQTKFPIIGDVRGQGLFLGFELCDEMKAPLTEKANYLANRMKELGILMSTDGKDNNVLKIKPPMVFSIENAKELLFRLKTIFSEDFMTK